MNSDKQYIYCLEFYEEYNEKTGKHDDIQRYIGTTKNLKRRWKELKAGSSGVLRYKNINKCNLILKEVGNNQNVKELKHKWIDYYGGKSKLINFS